MTSTRLFTLLVAIGAAALAVAPGRAQTTEAVPDVRVQLVGDTQTWSDPRPVLEAEDDAAFQAERYGKQFAYRFYGLPAGSYSVKLGFCENKFEPGERVFNVLINGRTVLQDFDIVAETGRKLEALIKTVRVQIGEEPLEIAFQGTKDNAKINLIRIYNDKLVVKILPGSETQTTFRPEKDSEAPYMLEMYETALAKLGSRLCINPRPQSRVWRQSALGHADYNVAYFEKDPDLYRLEPVQHVFGVRCGAQYYSLPFDKRCPSFPHVAQEQTLTSLTYRCSAPGLPVELQLTFRAPFYPQDVRISTAPFIFLDVTLTNKTGRPQEADFVLGESQRARDKVNRFGCDTSQGLVWHTKVFGKATNEVWAVPKSAAGVTFYLGNLPLPEAKAEAAPSATRDEDGRLVITPAPLAPFHGAVWQAALPPHGRVTQSFIYVGYVAEPVLEVIGRPTRFKYHEFFKSAGEVADYAWRNRGELQRKTALFESTVSEATLSPALRELLAFAFQSWLMNTWWTVDQEGNDWFSVWEGCCKFHSTVDVEYNVAPIYFQYWPELMKITLDEWSGFVKPGGIMSHDMGMGLVVDRMQYGHDMEIEENTNYVLGRGATLRHLPRADGLRSVGRHGRRRLR